ncbi:MAG: hypothetical protein K1X64_04860 [Myxococcaceae bacterium]|nr:hypothetical protein [Myxococcaceae bacterium]
MSLTIRSTTPRIVSAPASTSTSSAVTAKTATVAQMKAAKKAAAELGKFFKKTMARYDKELAKPGSSIAKAVKATFGSRAQNIPPEYRIGRQTMAPQFFYMSTVIDTRTGALSQSVNATAPFFGPLLPPANARIKGLFTPTQATTLINTVVRNSR